MLVSIGTFMHLQIFVYVLKLAFHMRRTNVKNAEYLEIVFVKKILFSLK